MQKEMEMPTPCKVCGEWFELHKGGPSKDGRYQLCLKCSEEDNNL